jgi:3-oxoacyl-[acyl-carrier-protein] synthase III
VPRANGSTVDLLVAHRAIAPILEAVGARRGLPSERVVVDLARIGNTSAVSIPMALGDAVEAGT